VSDFEQCSVEEALFSALTFILYRCGITVASTILLELPIFYTSSGLLRRLGPEALLSIACVAYIVRTIGYVLVPEMSFVVISLDLLHGISFACSQIAGVQFVATVMPDTYEASGQGVLLIIRGAGATIGLFVGGIMEDTLGSRGLYACLSAVVTFGLAILGVASMTKRN
jgi:PPP family 3-phenylpropionic acid transporter